MTEYQNPKVRFAVTRKFSCAHTQPVLRPPVRVPRPVPVHRQFFRRRTTMHSPAVLAPPDFCLLLQVPRTPFSSAASKIPLPRHPSIACTMHPGFEAACSMPCSSHAHAACPCSSHAHAGCSWLLLLAASCCWLPLLAAGCCWLLLKLAAAVRARARLVESLKNF